LRVSSTFMLLVPELRASAGLWFLAIFGILVCLALGAM
jgi:hypothetical protein